MSDDGEAEEKYWRELLIEEGLAQLPESNQKILRLHYLEGYSAPEIAILLKTTPRYAEKLIHNALVKVRLLWKSRRI